MTRQTVLTALTLYDAGTLTASQAASRAGVSEERFTTLCERFCIEMGDSKTPLATSRPASAD